MKTTTKGPDNDTITVFCLNLRFGLADDGPKNWEHRRRVYPPLLASHPADFYAFQEANDFQITFLQSLLPDHGVIGQRSPAPPYWQNNVIFYHRRWAIQNSVHFYLSHTPDIPSKFTESRWPRQCTMGTFEKGTAVLTVVNTHFDFDAQVQRQSALLIADRLKGLPAGHPVVMMGDFNAVPGSSCVKELMAKPVGFKSAFHPHHRGTYHGFSGAAEGDPIDWILFRGAIEQKAARIISQSINGIYPSDHFPLVAIFRRTG